MTEIVSREVKCGSCTLCCRGEQIILDRSAGDNPAIYVKVASLHGLTGEKCWVIPHKPGTDECHYLGPLGCTIHEYAPAMCKAFSCVDYFLNTPRAERRRRERAIPGAKRLFDRGRELAEGKP